MRNFEDIFERRKRSLISVFFNLHDCTLNRVKLGRAVTFMKYLASVILLIFLAKTLICNKITFPASNLLNLVERVVNEPTKCV